MDRQRYKLLIPFALVGAAGITLARVEGAERLLALIPLRCPLHFLTGVHCPTCGLGHSLLLLAQGEWSQSWQVQPLGLFSVGLATAFCLLPASVTRGVASLLQKWSAGVAGSFFLYALFRAA